MMTTKTGQITKKLVSEPKSSDKAVASPRKLSAEHKLLLIFGLFTAGIIATGINFCCQHSKMYSDGVYRQLSAIAELKMDDLKQWREDKKSDASIFFNNPSFNALVRRIFDKPDDSDAQRQLKDWLKKYSAMEDYDQVSLMDTQGVVRLAIPYGLKLPPCDTALAAAEALRLGQISILDFHLHSDNQSVYLAVLVPLFDETDAKRPLGVLFLRILPGKYLYPLMKRWPVPSATAEIQLVRKDGNEVLYLSSFRSQTNASQGLRISLRKTEILAVKAVMGQTGLLSDVKDFRGVPVIATIHAVPDSPWFLVTKIDKAEVLAPLYEQLWGVVILIVALLLGLGEALLLFWRQQVVTFYRERAIAVEKLLASEAQHRVILQMAMDAISQVDMEGRLLEVNEAYCRMSGYSNQELLAMRMSDLEADSINAVTAAHFQKAIAQGEDRFETRYRRKDGSDWDVDISLQYKPSNVGCFVVFIHDITKRKITEMTLQQQADGLRVRNDILTRFNDLMVGRELRMIELKREVNELSQRLGEPPRHKIVDTSEEKPSLVQEIERQL
ncbi:MAG: PAS domain S-box protein [bacterium]